MPKQVDWFHRHAFEVLLSDAMRPGGIGWRGLCRAALLGAVQFARLTPQRSRKLRRAAFAASSRIITTAFSASITAAAWVLPETSVGMTEQSTTRSPWTQRSRARSLR